ncbi:3D domain-containing protein [Sporosarcina sp. ACRSL]|uniref:3D domain-containing protein n=1 Tax=Sporosarcina sp. ACRSL TaxID=2918215 RepID=UPI001EF7188C|nr:3D domain-containing protein [Sporosarcina sp. ACRSL]MCG7345334.1 3D domain-containing protein [Sporosarcina sp. ACRSL]
MLFLGAIFGGNPKEVEEDEEAKPIPPVYDDTHEIATLDERRQANETKLARARSKESIRQARIAKAVASKAQAKPKPATVSRNSNYVGQAQTFEATAFTAYCEGCTGITRTGHDLRKSIYSDGYRVIATDPRRIPLGSIVRVTLSDGTSFEAIASDTGGRINGAIIDVAHETNAEALEFGRQSVEIRMIRRGGN